MTDHLSNSPAARVIAKCGGINETARLIGLHRSVVNRWLTSKDTGGTGGLVPSKHQQALLDRNPDLSPADFFSVATPAPADAAE
jgi:hypothetical protein